MFESLNMLGFTNKNRTLPKVSPRPKLPNSFFYDEDDGSNTGQKGPLSPVIEGNHVSNGLVASRIEIYEGAWRVSNTHSSQQPSKDAVDHQNDGASSTDENLQYQTLGYRVTNGNWNSYPEYATLSKLMSPPASVRYSTQNGGETLKARAGVRSGKFKPEVNSKDPWKQEQLHNKLLSYSMFGLPRLPRHISKFWEIREGEETSIHLESSWKEIIQGHEVMTRKQYHQQEAIWELLYTELSYLKKLKVITDLFICGLINLQQEGILKQVHPEAIFSNISEIIRVHRKFWRDVMAPVLQEARQSQKPFHPLQFYDGFRKFSERFTPYIQYCMDEEKCMENARILFRDNDLFQIYIKWAETHKQCNRLRLMDMLVKPHQRITKYPLLLKAILKRTDDSVSRDALFRMISNTEQFLHYIDSQMLQREEQQKLAAIACRIGAYEVLEPTSEEVEKHVKEFCSLNLTSPMTGVGPNNIRQLLLEGNLKMKESKDGKMEVYCFLFTDVFLITKPVKKTELAKVIRQPLMVERIICRELKDPGTFLLLYLNEFQCIVLAVTFQTSNSKEWMDAINKTKDRLQKMKLEEAERQEKELQRIFENMASQSNISTSGSPDLSHRRDRLEEKSSHNVSEFTTAKPHLVVTDESDVLLYQDVTMETGSTDTALSAAGSGQTSISEQGSTTGAPRSDPQLSNSVKEAFSGTFASPRLQRRQVVQKKRKAKLSDSSLNISNMPKNTNSSSRALSPHGFIRVQDLDRPMASSNNDQVIDPLTLTAEGQSCSDHETSSTDDEYSINEVFIFPQDELPPPNPEIRNSPTVVEILLRAQAREREWKNYCASDSQSFISDSISEFSDMEELEFVKGHASFINTVAQESFEDEAFFNEEAKESSLARQVNPVTPRMDYNETPGQVESDSCLSSKDLDSFVPHMTSVEMEELLSSHGGPKAMPEKGLSSTMLRPQPLHQGDSAITGTDHQDRGIFSATGRPRLLSANSILGGRDHQLFPSGLEPDFSQCPVSGEILSKEGTVESSPSGIQMHVSASRILTIAELRRLRNEQQGSSF